VAINRFDTDTDKEIQLVIDKALALGADDCVVSEVWAQGSKGGIAMARAVMKLAERKNNFSFLYSLEDSLKDKIAAIATRMYGAGDVEYYEQAEKKISIFRSEGWDKLPVCMTKTHLSLSHDPGRLGRPSGFTLPIKDIRAFIGSGFLSPMCGEINTMPGLPRHPAGEKIDIDEHGNIVGLF
jgi:formyltetrahydrofolate synthetase